jgi:hypothetical protein
LIRWANSIAFSRKLGREMSLHKLCMEPVRT